MEKKKRRGGAALAHVHLLKDCIRSRPQKFCGGGRGVFPASRVFFVSCRARLGCRGGCSRARSSSVRMWQVLTNLNEHGNTSAGSIPIALAAAVKSGQVKKGDVIACAGFGAGLSWGAAIIEWG